MAKPQPVAGHTITPTETPDPESIRAGYGFVGKLADSVPELNGILSQATTERWTTDRFLMSVANTDWYKNNSSRARDWIMKQATDPAQANEELLTATDKINTLAGHLGITVNGDQARDIAMHEIIHNLSAEQLSAHMSRNYFSGFQDWNTLKGKSADYGRQIQEIGAKYGWRDFDNYDSSRDWLNRLMSGADSIEGFHGMVKNYAKVKYPGFQKEIESGLTMQDIAKPYVEAQAKLLEVPHNIPLDDPLLNRALQNRTPDGAAVPMTVIDHEKNIRQDPRWWTTQNALDSAAKTATEIGRAFGMVAK